MMEYSNYETKEGANSSSTNTNTINGNGNGNANGNGNNGRGSKRKGENDTTEDEQKKKLRVPEEPSRSVYLGNLHPETTYHDICQVANHYGPIELAKLLPNKCCAFLNFVNQPHAEEFHRAASNPDMPIIICGNPIKVGWAKSNPINSDILKEIEGGATRSLFVGSVAPSVSEEIMAEVFGAFGEIDSIIILRDKGSEASECLYNESNTEIRPKTGIAFVNLTSIKGAITAKSALAGSELHGRRIHVNFAKESKGVNPTRGNPQQHQQQSNSSPRQRPSFRSPSVPSPFGTSSYVPLNVTSPRRFQAIFPALPNSNILEGAPVSRSLYLGNLHPDTTYHDILPLANRYGAVEYAKIVLAKKCAFINFVDDRAAQAFYYNSFQQLNIRGNDIRLGWAKSSPIAPSLLENIRAGATRNLFLGNITETVTEEMLKNLFSPFGEFDSISILHQKGIAFVNMTSINGAVTARNALQAHELEGKPLKINFAKEAVKFRG